jgi:hypothetical protein
MVRPLLPADALRAADVQRRADIVVGIPSYNNEKTIAHVVRAAHAGLAKYFPQYTSVIINSDGGSTDRTREAALSTRLEDLHLLLLSHPVLPVHWLSAPYYGLPGRGSAVRLILGMAELLGARACVVVESGNCSVTPEWIELLLRPVLHSGFDFTTPYYHRHKHDGAVTSIILYPLMRALYGLGIRQPAGGEFGLSAPLIRHLVQRKEWETDVAHDGNDLWLTTVAICEGFRVCQSFLSVRSHEVFEPGTDLSSMLTQVVGSAFDLMQRYDYKWRKVVSSKDAALFGFRYGVGLDPVAIDTGRMIRHFRQAVSDLPEIWGLALRPETLDLVRAAAAPSLSPFHIGDDLWVRVVYEFACAYHKGVCSRGTLMRSLTPLYLAKSASLAIENQNSYSPEVETRTEQLCRSFELLKPDLVSLWFGRKQPMMVQARQRLEVTAAQCN